MLAPNPLAATVTWPIPGDVPSLLVIVGDQAETIAAQEALLHGYQGVLNAAQASVPGIPATSNAGAVTASASVPVTGTVGTIQVGAAVVGAGIVAGTTVLGQISGVVGGDGTYLLSAAATLLAGTALTFTPPGTPSTWPVPQDAVTLNLLAQQQTAVIRTQTALLQHYQDVLNTSETPAPPAGP